jgi:hypothetical protein
MHEETQSNMSEYAWAWANSNLKPDILIVLCKGFLRIVVDCPNSADDSLHENVMNLLHTSCFLTPGIQTSGDVSRHPETSAGGGGDDGNDDGAEAEGDDVSEDPEETKKSISDELAEIQSSLAMIGRQNKVAHGILVYLILSTTIPAMTLIRVSLNAILNPLVFPQHCE